MSLSDLEELQRCLEGDSDSVEDLPDKSAGSDLDTLLQSISDVGEDARTASGIQQVPWLESEFPREESTENGVKSLFPVVVDCDVPSNKTSSETVVENVSNELIVNKHNKDQSAHTKQKAETECEEIQRNESTVSVHHTLKEDSSEGNSKEGSEGNNRKKENTLEESTEVDEFEGINKEIGNYEENTGEMSGQKKIESQSGSKENMEPKVVIIKVRSDLNNFTSEESDQKEKGKTKKQSEVSTQKRRGSDSTAQKESSSGTMKKNDQSEVVDQKNRNSERDIQNGSKIIGENEGKITEKVITTAPIGDEHEVPDSSFLKIDKVFSITAQNHPLDVPLKKRKLVREEELTPDKQCPEATKVTGAKKRKLLSPELQGGMEFLTDTSKPEPAGQKPRMKKRKAPDGSPSTPLKKKKLVSAKRPFGIAPLPKKSNLSEMQSTEEGHAISGADSSSSSHLEVLSKELPEVKVALKRLNIPIPDYLMSNSKTLEQPTQLQETLAKISEDLEKTLPSPDSSPIKKPKGKSKRPMSAIWDLEKIMNETGDLQNTVEKKEAEVLSKKTSAIKNTTAGLKKAVGVKKASVEVKKTVSGLAKKRGSMDRPPAPLRLGSRRKRVMTNKIIASKMQELARKNKGIFPVIKPRKKPVLPIKKHFKGSGISSEKTAPATNSEKPTMERKKPGKKPKLNVDASELVKKKKKQVELKNKTVAGKTKGLKLPAAKKSTLPKEKQVLPKKISEVQKKPPPKIKSINKKNVSSSKGEVVLKRKGSISSEKTAPATNSENPTMERKKPGRKTKLNSDADHRKLSPSGKPLGTTKKTAGISQATTKDLLVNTGPRLSGTLPRNRRKQLREEDDEWIIEVLMDDDVDVAAVLDSSRVSSSDDRRRLVAAGRKESVPECDSSTDKRTRFVRQRKTDITPSPKQQRQLPSSSSELSLEKKMAEMKKAIGDLERIADRSMLRLKAEERQTVYLMNKLSVYEKDKYHKILHRIIKDGAPGPTQNQDAAFILDLLLSYCPDDENNSPTKSDVSGPQSSN